MSDREDDVDGACPSKKPRLDARPFSRCRKPFKNTDKCSAKNLRPTSVNHVEKFNPSLSPHLCRNLINFLINVGQRLII